MTQKKGKGRGDAMELGKNRIPLEFSNILLIIILILEDKL